MNQKHNPVNTILSIVIIVMLVVCSWLIFWTTNGYGSVKFDLPPDVSVQVNGHTTRASFLKLRTGSYTVLMTSPTYYAQTKTLKIGLHRTTDFNPYLAKRTPVSVLTSAIASAGLYGKPNLTSYTWSHGNTWLAGRVGPSSNSYIALHYSANRWGVGYFNAGGNYPQDMTILPADVAAIISALQEHDVQFQ